jgi:dipicolinate synthase subunit B
MGLKGKRIGFALTGSHCTIPDIWDEMEKLVKEGAELWPIVSPSVESSDTRFGKAEEIKERLFKITGIEPITSIIEAEPIGPQRLLDLLVIAPCTGNTIAKLANGITDTVVLMAAKAHLRNERPVIIGISTNDGLSANLMNVGLLMTRKHIYFVPFGQDNPVSKPNSLVAHMDLLQETILGALVYRQIQPILVAHKKS